MTKTGPNDASGVVWAIRYVFFSFRVFCILTNNLSLEDTGRAAATQTGPNDAPGVVWAIMIGVSYFFFCIFCILTNNFGYI